MVGNCSNCSACHIRNTAIGTANLGGQYLRALCRRLVARVLYCPAQSRHFSTVQMRQVLIQRPCSGDWGGYNTPRQLYHDCYIMPTKRMTAIP